MEGRAFILEGPARGNPNTFLSSLVEFCVDSVSTCFSHDADKLCVPIGLSFLSALLLLLSCFLLLCQGCKCLRQNPGETITFLYSLLGNLCSTVGAILSRQLHIQVLIGAVAAAVDAVHFIACFPLLCWNSKAERRLRMMRARRRQHLLAVCVLMVVAGGFLNSRVTHRPADGQFSGRRLLHFTLQDNTEILGYVLGLLSFVIACTSRFPALRRAYRGQMLTRAYMFSGLLCSLAGALYAAAILLYDTQLGFLLKVMPWLLSTICCVTLDLLILVIHWCRRGTRQQLTSFSADTESLLGGSRIPNEDKGIMERQRKQQVHSSAQTKTKKGQKMTEMGRYMDVSVQPARKICLKEVLSKEEVKDRRLNRNVQVTRVDRFCSSDTSHDSSLVSSDLEWSMEQISPAQHSTEVHGEWDFEEATAQWSEAMAKQQHPLLQGWPANHTPCKICICAMSRLSQKTPSGTEEGERVFSPSVAK